MSDVSETSEALFEEGLFCAESVLQSIAQQYGVSSPLIPGIATGLCSGVARTGGTCGALTGAVLGVNLVSGRENSRASVEKNYQMVGDLVGQFSGRFGSTECPELLGCHLGTPEGQQQFTEQNLGQRCREYTRVAAFLADQVIKEAEGGHGA